VVHLAETGTGRHLITDALRESYRENFFTE